MRKFRNTLAALLLLGMAPGIAWPAFVTLNEAGMDEVYSQGSFGVTPIDIRFNAVVEIEAPHLLTIDSLDSINELFDLSSDPAPTVSMFFVDSIDWCGTVSAGYAGCALEPGSDFVVESVVAAGGFGVALNSHELAHNLGLGHETPPPDNLMNPSLTGNTTLTATQVATILTSPLLQLDGSQFFVEITPVLISGATVPLPASLPLALGAFGLLGLLRRRTRPAGLSG